MTDRDAILARRRRLIALALAGGAAVTTPACEPATCLTVIDAPLRDVPDDAGEDAGSDAGDAATAEDAP